MVNSGFRRTRKQLTWACAFVLAVIGSGGALSVLSGPSDPASAAQVPIDQCNGVSNDDGAQTVECTVVIVNNLTDDPLTTGSVVTINGVSTASGDLVTSVNQCNNSANGGGNTLLCSVTITNNISVSGASAATPATINQCNNNQPDGLGTAPNVCVPSDASTTGATITQCNGSGNGGGLVAPSGCTASGTVSSTLPVTINQCNDSANGGGSRVVCSSTIETIVTGVQPTTTSSPGPTTTSPGPTTTSPGGPPTGGTLPSTR